LQTLPCGIVQGFNWDNPEPDQAPHGDTAESLMARPCGGRHGFVTGGRFKKPVNFISFNLFFNRNETKLH
jgi:hypothetical protein